MININGKEAKKHIQEALKIVFPGFKFSLQSKYDQVTVRWVDGPLTEDVERVLNRFESYTRVLCVTDYEKCTGYEWHGSVYAGPRYLDAIRTLSDDRKALLVAEAGSMNNWLDLNKPERVEIERDLIRMGKLESIEPRNCPDLMVDEKPVLDQRRKAKPESEPVVQKPAFKNNVVHFPDQSSNKGAVIMDDLTPEQKLKAHVLENILGHKASDVLHGKDAGTAVDYAFSLVARELYS